MKFVIIRKTSVKILNHQSNINQTLMTKKLLNLLFIVFSTIASAQVVGTITDTNNKPLPFVNILIENTYKGTTSNNDGYYELNISVPQTYTIVYSY